MHNSHSPSDTWDCSDYTDSHDCPDPLCLPFRDTRQRVPVHLHDGSGCIGSHGCRVGEDPLCLLEVETSTPGLLQTAI